MHPLQEEADFLREQLHDAVNLLARVNKYMSFNELWQFGVIETATKESAKNLVDSFLKQFIWV